MLVVALGIVCEDDAGPLYSTTLLAASAYGAAAGAENDGFVVVLDCCLCVCRFSPPLAPARNSGIVNVVAPVRAVVSSA